MKYLKMFAFQITCKALSCCQASIMWYLEMIDESGPEKVNLFFTYISIEKYVVYIMNLTHLFSFF